MAGTPTTHSSVTPVVINRGVFEGGMASVVMAYPTSELSDRQAVRLDFRWVVQILFTSSWAADPAEVALSGAAHTHFALSVLDESSLVGEFSAGYQDPESWRPVFGDRRPAEVLRHFHIGFDDFGRYDLIAVDCVARPFTCRPTEQRPWGPQASLAEHGAQQADEEALLLADAMALPPLPPISSYPLDDD